MVVIIMSTLIEGFPDEVSLMILARVPLYLHPRLRLVCHAWRAAVNSVELLKVRQEVNFIEDFMCVCSHEPDNIWQLHDAHHNVWITIPVLPSNIRHLSYFGAVSTAGKLYVLGGGGDPNDIANGHRHISANNQVWSYEPVTRRWTLCAPMILARAKFACGVLDGKIIVAGGFGNSFHRRPIKQAEMYDPKNDVWIPIPDKQCPLLWHGCEGERCTWCTRDCQQCKYWIKKHRFGQFLNVLGEIIHWQWLGDEVYVMCGEEIYHESQVRQEKQLKFTVYGHNKRSGFAMTSIGNSIYLIGGNELRGNIFRSKKYELPDVTILTLSLEEPWGLGIASRRTYDSLSGNYFGLYTVENVANTDICQSLILSTSLLCFIFESHEELCKSLLKTFFESHQKI